VSDSTSILREPWPNVERQRHGAAFGIWVFLATEMLFFGGLFLMYAVYRTLHPEAFHLASHETDILYGTTNTFILLTSSLIITMAERAAAGEQRRLAVTCLLATAALGMAFLAVKGFEYREDIAKGLLPVPAFPLHPPSTQLFWGLYWVMTGVHAIHLAIGVGVVLVLATLIGRRVVPLRTPASEVVSLYWHFVDVVWVTLFALIYLPGRP
jgi:cytochrome c oxidase subunit III